MPNQTPRILQPESQDSRNDNQKPAGSEVEGEGSYKGSRDYNQRTEEFLKSHDVEKEAEAAKPRSEQEARDMERAEEEGRSHSKGEH